MKHCSTKQPRGLVRLSVCAFCHRPPHQHGQSGHFVCLLLLCPWHRAGHLKAHVRTVLPAEGAQPGSILGHGAAPLCLPWLFTPQKEAQSVVQTWQDLATLSMDDSGGFPSRRSREACSLTVLPARCPEQHRPCSHARLEQHPASLQAPPLHIWSPRSSALCSPDPCIPGFAAQPSFALVHDKREAPLVWPVAPTDVTTPGHQTFIPPDSSSVSPSVLLVKKAWGHKRGTRPGTGGRQRSAPPAPRPSSAAQLVLPGLTCKEASPRGAAGPPVCTSMALVQRDLSQHALCWGKLHFTCSLQGSGVGEGRKQARPLCPASSSQGSPRPPLTRISTLGEGGEREGKAEPSSLFTSKGTLRLGKARCESECFALFYGCVFVLRVNFALAVARARAGDQDRAETTDCA